MAGWSGFTEKDLQKLKDETSDTSKTSSSEKHSQKPKPSKIDQRSTKSKARQIIRPTPQPQVEEQKGKENIVPKVSIKNVKSESADTKMKNEVTGVVLSDQPITDTTVSAKSEKESNCKETDQDNIRVLTDVEAAEEKMSSLEKLQIRQKQIEDENKKRQLMIKETLAARMKQTQHESMKLKELNKQLSKLDQLLQADVSILRNKIDEACVQFSHAQKRFQTAENEYVLAKLDFYKKKEHKDQLQECLYTIIQENELRKARKLEELMEKLANDSDSVPASPVKSPSDEQLPVSSVEITPKPVTKN